MKIEEVSARTTNHNLAYINRQVGIMQPIKDDDSYGLMKWLSDSENTRLSYYVGFADD